MLSQYILYTIIAINKYIQNHKMLFSILDPTLIIQIYVKRKIVVVKFIKHNVSLLVKGFETISKMHVLIAI